MRHMTSERSATPTALHTDLDDGVLTLCLQGTRPDDLIDVALSDALHAALQDATWNEDVRVVVIKGSDTDFSRGIDWADFREWYEDAAVRRAAHARLACWRDRLLPALPQPVIVSVRGACLGGALAIVAASDVAFAADDATFALGDAETEPNGAGLGATIERVVLHGDASNLLRGCNAHEAERIGLITRAMPLAQLDVEVGTLARELAAKDPIALRFTKQTVRHVGSMSWDAAVDYTAAKFAQLKALQADRPSTRAAAVESFLSGRSKPGLGS
jgi:feruloyl-CoA hydratase/lyase